LCFHGQSTALGWSRASAKKLVGGERWPRADLGVGGEMQAGPTAAGLAGDRARLWPLLVALPGDKAAPGTPWVRSEPPHSGDLGRGGLQVCSGPGFGAGVCVWPWALGGEPGGAPTAPGLGQQRWAPLIPPPRATLQ